MSALRIDVSDLLTHPGARRSVHLEDEVEDLRGSAASVTGPISLDLTLEHITDGVVVRGRLGATWRGECSVCLRDLEEPLDVVVDELFESDPVEGETYPLEGHEIDLEQLVREVARFGGDVSTMVPPSVSERLMKRYQELRALEELE